MKLPVKECTLCGSLVIDRSESIKLHVEFHKTTPKVPKRVQVFNSCNACHGPLDQALMCRNVNCPRYGRRWTDDPLPRRR